MNLDDTANATGFSDSICNCTSCDHRVTSLGSDTNKKDCVFFG